MVNAVAQPVLAKVGDDNERQLRVFRKMLRFTAFVAAPLMLGLSLVSEELIVVVITEKWIESAQMLQLLAIWGAFMPLQSMFTNLLVSRGKAAIFMWCTIVQGVLTLVLLLLLCPYGIRNMIIAYCIFNALWLFVWHHFAQKEIKLSIRMFLTDTLPYLCLATAVMAATHHLTLSIDNMYTLLLARIAIAALLYITIAWIAGSKELCEIAKFIFKRKVDL
jgi:O-antigen/teichoic acid export membrane protein